MSKIHRSIGTALAVIFIWPLAEFIWWLRASKWCKTPSKPSRAWTGGGCEL